MTPRQKAYLDRVSAGAVQIPADVPLYDRTLISLERRGFVHVLRDGARSFWQLTPEGLEAKNG